MLDASNERPLRIRTEPLARKVAVAPDQAALVPDDRFDAQADVFVEDRRTIARDDVREYPRTKRALPPRSAEAAAHKPRKPRQLRLVRSGLSDAALDALAASRMQASSAGTGVAARLTTPIADTGAPWALPGSTRRGSLMGRNASRESAAVAARNLTLCGVSDGRMSGERAFSDVSPRLEFAAIRPREQRAALRAVRRRLPVVEEQRSAAALPLLSEAIVITVSGMATTRFVVSTLATDEAVLHDRVELSSQWRIRLVGPRRTAARAGLRSGPVACRWGTVSRSS
jgi:hypothetical protein